MSHSIEVRLKDCAAQEGCDELEHDLMQEAAVEITQLREQLAKANETISALSLETDNAITLQAERNQLKRDLAKSNERVEGLELHANSIADALGFNAENNNRLATSVICTNIRNLHSFSDCLSRIENAFLMVESETDEFGETSEDVAFSKWGLTPHEYCIEFGKWLNKFALEKKIEALKEQLKRKSFKSVHDLIEIVIDSYENQLRKEQE